MSSSFQCNHTPSTNRITNATSISVRPNDKTAIHLFHSVSLILPISTCAILYDLAPHVHPCIIIFSATSFITIYSILFVSDITILPPIYSFILILTGIIGLTLHRIISFSLSHPADADAAAADATYITYPYTIIIILSIQYINLLQHTLSCSTQLSCMHHPTIIVPDQHNPPYLSPYLSGCTVFGSNIECRHNQNINLLQHITLPQETAIEERQWQKHALSIIQGIRILFTATSKTTTS
eukprot:805048_1